ncbi:30S ribosomal protein S6 [Patescibacteria group bacterium]|nr:30S ribosomal protein S6 [Patescibacteria group bacterium]
MNELENKKDYELAYLLTPDISEDKIEAEVSELKDFIAKNGGSVIQADLPEKRHLAYPVKKQNFAYFGVVYFNSDTESLDKIKKALVFYKKVLRYMLLNKATTHPSGDHPKGDKPTPIITSQSFEQRLESLLNS